MLKTILLTWGLVGIATTTALANPSTIPIDQAISSQQKLAVSAAVDHYLDFTGTRYRVIGAYPSNPQQFRAVRLSAKNEQELILRWTPGSSVPHASIGVSVIGPSGVAKTITFNIQRTKKSPDNIKTAFTQGGVEQIATGATPPSTQAVAPRPHRTSQNPPKITPKVPIPHLAKSPSPPITRIRPTPRPTLQAAKISPPGRPLINRSTLDHNALAHYLLRGLHRARGRQEINRSHDHYLRTQSMVLLLQRGVAVDQALRDSGLPEKTYNDLLGHGGVSR